MRRSESVHTRIYRLLLRLYPSEFRACYGEDMVQLFTDQLRDRRADGRLAGTARIWARTLGDLVATAASEHVRRDRSVGHSVGRGPSLGNRALGVTGILGGFLLAAALIPGIPWSWAVFNLRLVLFEGGAIAVIVATHRFLPDRWRWPSLLVSVPAILANSLHLVMSVMFVTRPQPPEPDPEFRPLYALAAIAMWLTTATFGLMELRLGVVSRSGALVLTVGSVLAVTGVSGLGFTNGPYADVIANFTVAGVGLVGLGWMLLGIRIAFRRRPALMEPSQDPRSGNAPSGVG